MTWPPARQARAACSADGHATAMVQVPFVWRPATPADVCVLAAIYRDGALRLGPLAYTPEQSRAWAAFAEDEPGFRDYVLQADTWIAERVGDARALGFCGASRGGDACEIHSLYVTPLMTRRGIGAAMLRRTLQRVEHEGATRFAAWVTPFSKPVFLAAGFQLAQTVNAPFAGVMFERYRVERG
ncbi:MAG: GNAT family N-acetyltransferase [Burkholderiales bacterium]|nr:GNAT family N-acetyltransferase [Burkholderiales bacterium]